MSKEEEKKEEEVELEIDLDLDKENCPIGINKEGKINNLHDGNRIPKKLFFGKDSPCDNTFHGKHQFYLYMAAAYTEIAAEHVASKDPKVKKTQKTR